MVLSLTELNVDPIRIPQVLELLHSVAGPARAQPGCLGFDVWIGDEQRARVLLFERWRSQEELAPYLRSELYRRVLVAMEMSCSEPDVQFFEVGDRHGMEWIVEARRGLETPRCRRGDAA